MSVKNIVEKILDDARVQESTILEKANKEAEKIVEVKEAEIASMLQDNKTKATAEGNNKKERLIQNAYLQVRNNKLKAKQEIISKVFEKALESLNNMSEADFVEFFKNTVSNANLKSNGCVLLNNDMYKHIESINVKDFNSNVVDCQIDDSIGNGFVIKVDNVYYNYTFKAILESLKLELTSEVNRELF